MNSPKEFPGSPALDVAATANKSGLRPRRSMHALESRIVFDGAAVAAVDALASTDATIQPDAVAPASSARNEIVFVESNVRDYQTLLNGIDPAAEVHVLDASQDGLAQIAGILDGRSGIDAIHIVSHGSEGSVGLGTLSLTVGNLQDHAADLATIGGALDADADILLYGCDVATGSDGAALIDALAQATQADIAASTDTTGAADKGGDWVLEYASGQVDTDKAISDAASLAYDQVLALPANGLKDVTDLTTSASFIPGFTLSTATNSGTLTETGDTAGTKGLYWISSSVPVAGAGTMTLNVNADGTNLGTF